MRIEHLFQLSVAVAVMTVCTLVAPSSATAKTLSEDGWNPEFWRSHEVVSGTIVSVQPLESGQSVQCKVESSVHGRFDAGAVVDFIYERPGHSLGTLPESTIQGLLPGIRVLLVIRTVDGRHEIPNNAGLLYHMMPRRYALYVAENADDESFRETLGLCRAISVADPLARRKALAKLQKDEPSQRMLALLRGYIVHSVRESEAALRQSRELLREWDARWEAAGGAPIQSGGFGRTGGL